MPKSAHIELIALFLAALLLNGPARAQETPKDHPSSSFLNGLKFRELGPMRGGRSCAVAGVPGKPNLFYFGATGGGVWKTTDGGRSWKNISDGYFGGSIGAIAVAQSDANVIYAGGGEKTVRGNVSHGYGVWRSVDAGRTWQQAGLTDSRHISRLRIHPGNPDIVYAAVMGDLYKPTQERGVYKTTDGGKSWKRILFANEDAGAVDLCLDPTNPRILFASTWNVRRTPHSLSSGGKGSGLWKSTDSGETWTEITRNEGLPKDTVGIIGVTVSPQNPDRIWAIVESLEGGVFRSENGGKTWRRTSADRNLRQRAWYYTRIYADPADADKVYVVNVAYHVSKDGGERFSSRYAPHGDHHDLWIAPEDPRRMIIGDDGGAQVTHDGGETWSTYHNQPTAQFYRVIADNHFPFRLYAAQQDNSTIRIQHRGWGGSIGDKEWEETAGCECGHIAPKPNDPEIVFGGCYGGYIQRRDHRTGLDRIVSVWPDNPMGHGVEGMRYRFQWNFPLFFSPHDPNTLYTCSQVVHRSRDEGQSWEIISPDLTRNDSTKMGPSGGPITKDNTSVEYYCTIFAAAESPLEPGLLWTGSDDGLVWVRRGEQGSWTNVTPKDLPPWAQINSLEPDPHNPAGCYIAATRYKSGDYTPYLFRTNDYGRTWTRITTGIDPRHFTRVIRSDPNHKGLLFAGTESGLYVTDNDGNTWRTFQQNLPIVPITDLTFKEGFLAVATQGRGLWILDDATPLHEWRSANAASKPYLYSPQDVWRVPGWGQAEPTGTGANHPAGLVARFHIPETAEKDTFELTITEENGNLVRRWSTSSDKKEETLKIKAGLNALQWDLNWPGVESFPGMILWWASLAGPQALPGEYRVNLIHKGDTLSREFNVKMDPRIPVDTAALRQQFVFLRSVNDKVREAHQAIADMRALRGQLKALLQIQPDTTSLEGLRVMVQAMDSVLLDIESALYQTRNESPQDPLNFPIRLTNKLAHLNSLMRQGPYPPTSQSMAVKEELEGEIDRQLARWADVRDRQVPELNRMVRERAVDVIRVPVRK